MLVFASFAHARRPLRLKFITCQRETRSVAALQTAIPPVDLLSQTVHFLGKKSVFGTTGVAFEM